MDYQSHLNMLPHHMQDGMKDYIEKGYQPGGFLSALLCNNLRQTFERADSINRERIFSFIQFLYSYAPSDCWGSEEKFDKWVERGGLEGLL